MGGVLETLSLLGGIISGLSAIILTITNVKSWFGRNRKLKEPKGGKGLLRGLLDSRTGRIVSPILIIVLLVVSYLLVPPKKHSVTIPHKALAAGENIIHLKSASPPYTGRWLFWDYLRLETKSSQKEIWKIGRGDGSHAEFDHYGYKTNFQVGTPADKFPQEINDLTKDKINVLFKLKPEELSEALVLTLASSSGSGLTFKVYVEVRNSKGNFEAGTYEFRTFWY